MKNKRIRIDAIREIIKNSTIGNQDDLLQALTEKGFSLTQATLSRDLKQMKVAKQPIEGGYSYILPPEKQRSSNNSGRKEGVQSLAEKAFLSLDFSGNIAVIKTKPGYAGSIASEIDAKSFTQFLGTIAGDDTILLIIREKISREMVIKTLSTIISGIR
ncbi:MAG: hypothetical protein JXQ69_06770 [Paludibacteraceae bacterium]|nr:hypothetical protein [Paludibacteraceae bacterium]